MSDVKTSIVSRIGELEKKIEELGREANTLSAQAADKKSEIEKLSKELEILLKTKSDLESV